MLINKISFRGTKSYIGNRKPGSFVEEEEDLVNRNLGFLVMMQPRATAMRIPTFCLVFFEILSVSVRSAETTSSQICS